MNELIYKFSEEQIKMVKPFTCFLLATNREYKISMKKGETIFSVKPPHFSQDEVMLENFYNALLEN